MAAETQTTEQKHTHAEMFWFRQFNQKLSMAEQCAINGALRDAELAALRKSNSRKATPEAKTALLEASNKMRKARDEAEEELVKFIREHPYPTPIKEIALDDPRNLYNSLRESA